MGKLPLANSGGCDSTGHGFCVRYQGTRGEQGGGGWLRIYALLSMTIKDEEKKRGSQNGLCGVEQASCFASRAGGSYP